MTASYDPTTDPHVHAAYTALLNLELYRVDVGRGPHAGCLFVYTRHPWSALRQYVPGPSRRFLTADRWGPTILRVRRATTQEPSDVAHD